MRKPTRLEQLGNLLTAMIGVIAGGQISLMVGEPPIISKNPAFADLDLRDFQMGGRYYGLISRVAKHLHVCPSTVRRTLAGDVTSARVTAAMIEAISKPKPQLNPDVYTPLSSQELAEFSFGGRYYGVFARVARKLQVTPTSVSYAARGKGRSDRILSALRTEMLRVDDDLAAGKRGL